MTDAKSTIVRSGSAPYVLYIVMLALMTVASLWPELRLWGLNWWAYWPGYVLVAILIIALAVLALVYWKQPLESIPTNSEEARPRALVLCLALTVVWGVLFVVLRTRIHLLGDGYTLLSLLSRDIPLVKPREWGESMIHIRVRDVLGGSGNAVALLSFRFVSITSGLIAVAATLWSSVRLFDTTVERMLFSFGILTCGFMLLFFGYVENYSLLVTSILLYTLAGLLACRGLLSKWWLLPLVIIPPFMHVIGFAIVPSLIFVVVPGEKGRKFVPKLVIAGLIVAAGVAWVEYKSASDLFLQLALLPVFADRFTVGSYTLFSLAHLADYANLLLLLVPGLPLLLVFGKLPVRGIKDRPEVQFLVVLTICCLVTAFAVDPKIGMARDWDLLAFAGVPLSVRVFYAIVGLVRSGHARRVAVLCITLGAIVLFSRVAVTTDSEAEVKHFTNYLRMDGIRGLAGWRTLADYYRMRGNQTRSQQLIDTLAVIFPGGLRLNTADSLLDKGEMSQARSVYYEVLDEYPLHHPAWFSLGNCYMDMRRLDSARICFEIANALNPYSPPYLNNLAGLHYYAHDYDFATQLWMQSYEVDHNSYAVTNLLHTYRAQGRQDEYASFLKRAAADSSALLSTVRTLARYQAQSRDSDVKLTLERLLRQYDDSAWVDSFYNLYRNQK